MEAALRVGDKWIGMWRLQKRPDVATPAGGGRDLGGGDELGCCCESHGSHRRLTNERMTKSRANLRSSSARACQQAEVRGRRGQGPGGGGYKGRT